MFDFVNEFSKSSMQELTVEERNILSVAFKNVVGTRRAAWRVISLIERKEQKKGAQANVEKAKTYKLIIEKELTDKCRKILRLIEDNLLSQTQGKEGQVFLQKMIGDYYRYIAEYQSGQEKEVAANKAEQAYNKALTIASSEDCL